MKLLAVVLGVIMTVTTAAAEWIEIDKDTRPYDVVEYCGNQHKVRKYPKFKIDRVWLDPSGYAIMVDWNGDGIEDTAHIHTVYMYMEDGTPVMICEGDVTAKQFLEGLREYYRLHSIKGGEHEKVNGINDGFANGSGRL